MTSTDRVVRATQDIRAVDAKLGLRLVDALERTLSIRPGAFACHDRAAAVVSGAVKIAVRAAMRRRQQGSGN